MGLGTWEESTGRSVPRRSIMSVWSDKLIRTSWCPDTWFRVRGSGFRVQGPGCRVQGSGFRVQGSGSRVQGSGFKVQGSHLGESFDEGGLPHARRALQQDRLLQLHTTFSISEQLLCRYVKRFRGGLVFKAHRLVYHSILGSRVEVDLQPAHDPEEVLRGRRRRERER